MTDSNLMTRDELRRLAALDVFGLLDEYEADLFNRSFHDASSSTQDEILVLQADLASDASLLPRENPDPSLRERVLDRVARAIEMEAEKLAPIATIGRNRAGVEEESPFTRTLIRSSRFWRAACFVLATSLLVTMFFYAEALRDGMTISRLLLDAESHEDLKAMIGPAFGDFVKNPNAVPTVFQPVADDCRASAVVFVNADAESVFLMTVGLPEGGEYVLRVRDGDNPDSVETIAGFESDGFMASLRRDSFDVASVVGATWEIFDTLSGRVVLTTARI